MLNDVPVCRKLVSTTAQLCIDFKNNNLVESTRTGYSVQFIVRTILVVRSVPILIEKGYQLQYILRYKTLLKL
jgi:hypothetical protein